MHEIFAGPGCAHVHESEGEPVLPEVILRTTTSGGFRVVPRIPWNPPLGCT